ncbi:MAG: DUF2946 family protein [Steroidobacteraceae bacterium]
MHRSHSRQLIALFTVLALLLATTTYVSHIHRGDAGGRNVGGHCDLCLQFAGAAGTPTPAKVILKTRHFFARLVLAQRIDEPTSHYQSRSHRSRAPPLLHLI